MSHKKAEPEYSFETHETKTILEDRNLKTHLNPERHSWKQNKTGNTPQSTQAVYGQRAARTKPWTVRTTLRMTLARPQRPDFRKADKFMLLDRDGRWVMCEGEFGLWARHRVKVWSEGGREGGVAVVRSVEVSEFQLPERGKRRRGRSRRRRRRRWWGWQWGIP
ncbi:uncharacterized protein [Physcomitrium patens]|uniref:uncharacterized protein n=1 Tax=Physcomitrium patens TaxID=3218 RepID=UPI000D157E3B|nr:uncharacterized protein LOC112275204 [Physcomitrium patens]|eukprot:XP_024361114.1 uncharacterized protein LOC112275204 [Physcomitrella patens]